MSNKRMILPFAFLIANSCASSARRATSETSAACPQIAPAGSPYPTISYATFVLDGEVIGRRRAERIWGLHNSQIIDTIPAVEALGRKRIKNTHILSPDSARLFEPCPGVSVVMIDSKHRWWWPW